MRQYTNILLYKLHWNTDIMPIIGFLLNPFSLKSNLYLYRLSAWFKYNFNCKNAFFFSTFSDSLYALLFACNIKRGDSILLSALSDTELVYPLLALGVKPRYVDIETATYTISPSSLKRKINKNVKMIIVSYTFGIPARIDEIKKIAKEKNILLVEDCRDIIGGEWQRKKLGTFGDATIIGFGRNKVISPLPGGIVLSDKKKIVALLKKIEQTSHYPSNVWIYYHLLYILFSWILQVSFFVHKSIGRLLLSLILKIRRVGDPILQYENNTYVARQKIKRMPASTAYIVLNHLSNLTSVNKSKVKFYEELVNKLPKKIYKLPKVSTFYYQIPILTFKVEQLKRYLRRRGYVIPEWYNRVIHYNTKTAELFGYKKGSCKVAESIMKYVLEMPSLPWGDNKQLSDVTTALVRFSKKNI